MVTSKGIKLRAIAERLEREAADLRRLADLEDNVARVTKASKRKAKKVAKAKKKSARKARPVKKTVRRATRASAKKATRATVRAAKKALGRA